MRSDNWWLCDECETEPVKTLGWIGWQGHHCEKCGKEFTKHPSLCDKPEEEYGDTKSNEEPLQS